MDQNLHIAVTVHSAVEYEIERDESITVYRAIQLRDGAWNCLNIAVANGEGYAAASSPSARVLTEVMPPLPGGAWDAVEEEPGLAPLAGQPEDLRRASASVSCAAQDSRLLAALAGGRLEHGELVLGEGETEPAGPFRLGRGKVSGIRSGRPGGGAATPKPPG